MSAADFIAIAPLLVLAAGATVLMLQIAFARGLQLTTWLSVAVLLLSALAVIPAAQHAPREVTALLQVDRASLVMCALFCLSAAATVLLSTDYLKLRGDEPEEYFLLLLLSVLGACVLAFSVHLGSLLLGLELMSVALYALIAYPDRSILPLEAAIKYLVLSGAASATALFGFALLYAGSGALDWNGLGQGLSQAGDATAMMMVGAAMVLAGLGFKLSVVPFHLWTPDVYDGAPAPITGYLASVAKAAVLFALLRLFIEADLFRYDILVQLIGLMAILSMLAGNLLALLQTNVKRMLAYSSIAHIGYLLILFMVLRNSDSPAMAMEAAIFYLVAYSATTVAAFGLLALLCSHSAEQESVELRQLTGMLWRVPWIAWVLLVAMLSLAGIPLTAGFIAKFYIIGAAVTGHNWILLAALIIGSALGIYYYLRVVLVMSRHPEEHDLAYDVVNSARVRLLSLALVGLILALGIVPQPFMEYLRSIL